MKRMRIPMSVALGAALSLTPLSFVSAKENPAPQNMAQQTSDVSAKDVGLNIDVDLLGISNSIADAIKSAQNRDGFVKNLMESSFYASGQKYNVMVFNLSQEYEDHFNGVQFYGSAVYDGITYGIWVFEDGSFTNKKEMAAGSTGPSEAGLTATAITSNSIVRNLKKSGEQMPDFFYSSPSSMAASTSLMYWRSSCDMSREISRSSNNVWISLRMACTARSLISSF